MKTIESQNKAITNFMLKGGTITQIQAYQKFQCTNLSGRISEIKKTHTISKKWVVTKSKKRVIEYSIPI